MLGNIGGILMTRFLDMVNNTKRNRFMQSPLWCGDIVNDILECNQKIIDENPDGITESGQ